MSGLGIPIEPNVDVQSSLETYLIKNDAWITFIPTVTQLGAITLTVTFARYIVLADTVVVQVRLAITSAGTAGNAIVIAGFPAPILPTNTVASEHVVGTAVVQNTGTIFYQGALVYVGVNDFRIQAHNETGVVGITPSFALASGDFIGFQGTWER